MLRRSMLSLAGVLLWMLVPGVVLAQEQEASLPDGAGKQLVERLCTGCHRSDQITRSSGYSSEGWKELARTMLDLSGSPEDETNISHYLAMPFPPHTRQAPTLIPGEAQIAFTDWQVPTLGQRSRDPEQAADGSICWAGQWGNVIGRINPATGEMQEYPLPEQSMPHTVTLDPAGHVWYTGNKNGTLGKLDPQTGATTVHKMPDPAAKDPHTAIFDQHGTLWCTLQLSNMVGRLHPALMYLVEQPWESFGGEISGFPCSHLLTQAASIGVSGVTPAVCRTLPERSGSLG